VAVNLNKLHFSLQEKYKLSFLFYHQNNLGGKLKVKQESHHYNTKSTISKNALGLVRN
jgi:hypothetical protein